MESDVELTLQQVRGVSAGPVEFSERTLEDVSGQFDRLFVSNAQIDSLEGALVNHMSGGMFQFSVTGGQVNSPLGSEKASNMVDASRAKFSSAAVREGNAAPLPPAEQVKLDRLIALTNDIHLSSLKFKTAWHVLNGLSKDIKMLLQAQ